MGLDHRFGSNKEMGATDRPAAKLALDVSDE